MDKEDRVDKADKKFEYFIPNGIKGLSSDEVRRREADGKKNVQPDGITHSVGYIIRKNTLTLFNIISVVLFVIILMFNEIKHAMFIGVAVCNTLMGIFQELRAKRTLDKMAILAQAKVASLRNGEVIYINQEEAVMDDVIYITTGDQICVDSQIIYCEGFEADESLLTGEPDKIIKKTGDKVLSGSFAVSGHAFARVIAVGKENYATALTIEAKKEKKPQSQLMRSLNNIIKVLTIIILPLGGLLFYNQYTLNNDITGAIKGASSAILGMIPEGLILLTGVTLTVGAIKLTRKKALVQSLSSIETLARVDVLCLDKTGTITDGTLTFEKFILSDGVEENNIKEILAEMSGSLQDNNATAKALMEMFGKENKWKTENKVNFSSARKWSAVSFKDKGSYIMGAPAFIFPQRNRPFFKYVDEYAQLGYRVLCIAHSPEIMNADILPNTMQCIALIIMSDTIRKEAPDTFKFFEEEGVTLKVISGDDAVTVSIIAAKAGIKGAEKYYDMSRCTEETNMSELVEKYVVFGRVSPQQKRSLIKALKDNGHTACMTGDGVNDVLAMKEADCSVAMINGSDAARGASDFVLMTSDFSAMIQVLQEGRQVINNIEAVAALYLVKTVYSTLLSIIYIFLNYSYPFTTLNMMPINTLAVGIPTFFLALRKNHSKPEGRFLKNVIENSLPAALTIVFNILVVQGAGVLFSLPPQEVSTMCVLLTGTVGFTMLIKTAKPLSKWITVMMVILITAFIVSITFFRDFFELSSLLTRNVYFYLPLIYASPNIFLQFSAVIAKINSRRDAVKLRKAGKAIV